MAYGSRATILLSLWLLSVSATDVDQILTSVETTKCNLATATGTAGILGSLSGCAPPPPNSGGQEPGQPPIQSGPSGQPPVGNAPGQPGSGPISSTPSGVPPSAAQGPFAAGTPSRAFGPFAGPQPSASNSLGPAGASNGPAPGPVVPAPQPAAPIAPACLAINLAAATAPQSVISLQTPGVGVAPVTSVGQTFTTGGECVILSSFTLGLLPQIGTTPVNIEALLYTFDDILNRVIGSPLASSSTSVLPTAASLTVTFPQPVQLNSATSYAIILTTSGQGQLSTSLAIDITQSPIGNPNDIPGGRVIYLSNGDNLAAIGTLPFTSQGQNLLITIN